MLNYQQQASTQSLAEGIAEYHAAFAGELSQRAPTPEAQAFFASHDVIHVLLGCGIELEHEAVVKIMSFIGTDGGKLVIDGYRLPESKEIYRTLGIVEILRTIAWSLFLVPRTAWRCLRMPRRWPWANYDQFLDVSLCELRATYQIKVMVQ